MGKKIHSIHILNSDIERVSLCLGNCQMTHGNQIRNFLTKTNSLKGIMGLFKEETATYYILQTGNVISVYSTYFENDFNIQEISHWFAGESSYIFFLDYFDDSMCRIDLFKKYKFLTPLILEQDIRRINRKSSFNVQEIGSVFHISESQLEADFEYLEEYLFYYSMLLNIPFNLSMLDVIEDKKVERITYYL